MTSIWILLGAAFVLAALTVFLIAPGRMPMAAKKAALHFYGCNCAHRGLYRQDQSIPENSLPAFAAARDAGYGVELDVQLSKDGQVLVFHDDDLARVCGVDAAVASLDWKALAQLELFQTREHIPLLCDVLEVLEETPVIVELKPSGSRNVSLCLKTLDILRAQGRNWCVESFDPRIVAWFRKNAPDVLRGQLSNPARCFTTLAKPLAYAIGTLLTNALSRPHFIAYLTGPRPLTVRLCRAMNPMTVIWTVRQEHNPVRCERENDVVIFEFYTPPPRYKHNRTA